MTSDLALSVALFAGYLALILFALWPSSHICHDQTCRRLRDEHDRGKEFK